jgi:hypothetical protein
MAQWSGIKALVVGAGLAPGPADDWAASQERISGIRLTGTRNGWVGSP